MTTACIGVTLLVLAPYANISSPSRLFRPMHHLHHPESALGRRAAAVDYKYAETIETTTGSADIVAANEVAATEMASAVGANTDDAATTHGTIEPAPLVLPLRSMVQTRRPLARLLAAAPLVLPLCSTVHTRSFLARLLAAALLEPPL